MGSRCGSYVYYSLGSKLREARHKCNLHPSAVTTRLGYTDCRIVEQIESGEIKVALTDLPVLAKALNLPLHILFELVDGYHPGLVQKAREIGQETFEVDIDDSLLVAIILSGIENQQALLTRH